MEEHVSRLIAEKDELCKKLVKLQEFIMSPKFKELSPTEQDLLAAQSATMASYSAILTMRLRLVLW